MKQNNWIEINSQKDLPKDKDLFCWWINRVNGILVPSKFKGLLGQPVAHLTFSHYMPMVSIPEPPKDRKQLTEKQKNWGIKETTNIMNILQKKHPEFKNK